MKHKKFVNLYYLILIIFAAKASIGQSFSPITDETAIRGKLKATSVSTTSIKAAFVQEKSLSILTEKIVSKGMFYFKQKDRVRLEYQVPFKYIMILDHAKVTIKDNSKTTQMDVHKNKIFQQVNQLIIDCVHGSALSNPDFKIKILESSTEVKLDMKPISKVLQQFFSNIVIFIDKKDYSVSKMQMNELGGDYTTITFTNKEINGMVSDALFTTAK